MKVPNSSVIAPSSIIMSHNQHVKMPDSRRHDVMSSSSQYTKPVESPRIIKRAKIKKKMTSILQSEASEQKKPQCNDLTLKKPIMWGDYLKANR